MAKTTINVSISEGLKELAQRQVEINHFSTMSDYITYLIRTDAEKTSIRSAFQAQGIDFDQFIQAGIDSGISELSGHNIHEEARQRIAAAATAKKKK
jgi:Arc/MetJ-type ribon-helix-helix transcriptional regulator